MQDCDLSSSTSGYELPVKARVYGSTLTSNGPSTSASADSFAWNVRFQEVLQEIAKLDVETDFTKRAAEVWMLVDALGQDLVYCASTYAKVIISELGLPLEQKTIRPITNSLGGIAGGEKYVVANLLFKFAVDSSSLFGNDDASAAKVATADLRGLNFLLTCESTALHFPMMVLCDYRGFRMIAESIVPISPDSLVYGTATAGRIVLNEDPIVDAEMKLISTKLNLLPHNVAGKTIHTAADLEVHRSPRDNRFYCVDFSRVFPPEAPFIAHGNDPAVFVGGYLFRHLRPEFVRLYREPLSSDTYSGFGRIDHKINTAKVAEATNYLHSTIIPQFASQLVNKPTPENVALSDGVAELLLELHAAGINIRHLGIIRSLLPANSHDSVRLLIEMIGRLVKCELASKIRSAARRSQIALEATYKSIAVDYFNMLFGENGRSFWTTEVKEKLTRKFHKCLTKEEMASSYDIREALTVIPGALHAMFISCCHHTNLRFREHTSKRFMNVRIIRLSTPLHIVDLEQMQERVKVISLFTFASAYALQSNGLRYASTDKDMYRHLITSSLDKYREALIRTSSSAIALRNYAQMLAWEGETKNAGKYFERALSLSPNDPSSHLAMSKWLTFESRIDEAEAHLVLALKASPLSHVVCKKFAHFVLRQKRDPCVIQNAYAEVIAKDGDPNNLLTKACARAMGTVIAGQKNDKIKKERREEQEAAEKEACNVS